MVSIPNSTNYIFTSNNNPTPLVHHYAATTQATLSSSSSSKFKPTVTAEFYGTGNNSGNNSATTTSFLQLNKNESEFNEFQQPTPQHQSNIFYTTEFINKYYDQTGGGGGQYNTNTSTTSSYPAFYSTNYVKQSSNEYSTYLNNASGFSVYDRSVSLQPTPYVSYFNTQSTETHPYYLNETKEIEKLEHVNSKLDVNGFLNDTAVDQTVMPKGKKQGAKLPSSSNQKKTRTKDKYRVVYNELQRTELEREFNFSQYITSRRKAELASVLSLSTRQIKIWFQNRRAKDRKLSKRKKNDPAKQTTAATSVHTSQSDFIWPQVSLPDQTNNYQHIHVYSTINPATSSEN